MGKKPTNRTVGSQRCVYCPRRDVHSHQVVNAKVQGDEDTPTPPTIITHDPVEQSLRRRKERRDRIETGFPWWRRGRG